MPARSNNFQRVVKYLYDQISNGATVTESGFLKERDGTPREVDLSEGRGRDVVRRVFKSLNGCWIV
jgi:hypothetical protein